MPNWIYLVIVGLAALLVWPLVEPRVAAWLRDRRKRRVRSGAERQKTRNP